MKHHAISISFLVVSLLLTISCLSFADAERNDRIVALVTKVMAPPKGSADTVELWMMIHAPSRFGGFQFIVVTESIDRARIRADYPLGSLQTLEFPARTIKELEAQIQVHVCVEKQLDSGIDPAMISQGFTIPTIKFSELPIKPVKLIVITE
jgi:hypothetical protein